MKKKLAVIVGIVVLILLVIFFNKPSSGVANFDGSMTIGALAPQTGQLSVIGERMVNGMELARADLVEKGVLTSVNIIYEDACDSKTSLDATKKLVEINKVPAIGSSFCLFGIDAVVPITEANKVILFNTAANPESVLNKDYVFSTNVTIRDDAEKMAEFAVNKLSAKTAAIIHLDTSFGESYRNNFTRAFESAGGKVLLAEAKLPDATDFRTELTKIKALKPDLLLIVHFGSSLGNAIKQARQLGIDATLMGDYESEDPTVVQFAGSAIEGLIISSSQPEKETVNVRNFRAKYEEKYGEQPDVLASNAYDSVMLIGQTYSQCTGDTYCMADKLSKVNKYDGVSGQVTVDSSDHSIKKPTIFKIVKDGKFVGY